MTNYGRISSLLGESGDDELARLIDTRPEAQVGVGGGSRRIDVDGTPVFVKRIPLSDLELAYPRSTANIFGLPLFCQYGVGGPGFGAWRELAANEIVTDAVLKGQTRACFPMLYHWRVLAGRPPVAAEHADIDKAVAALGNSAAVRARLEALASASWSLVLFQEYLADPLTERLASDRLASDRLAADRLVADPEGIAVALERNLGEIVKFLRDQRLLHMDGHVGNMRIDGERIYLTDFGLVTSPRFELSPPEREFAARHAGHDAGYAAMVLANWLVANVCGIRNLAERNACVRRCAEGELPEGIPPGIAAILARHATAAATMNDFYWRLFGGDVHAEYPY